MCCSTIRIIVFSFLLLTAFAQKIQASPVSSAEGKISDSDSLSVAYGIILANFISQDCPTDSVDKQEFVDGLRFSKETKKNRYYYYGILNGLAAINRIETMNSMDIPLDVDSVFEQLIGNIENPSQTCYSIEQANNIINNYVASTHNLMPDTLSVAEEQKFIDSVGALPGAIVLPSGVVLVKEREGNGSKPVLGNMVSVSYIGRLSDGTVFDETESPLDMRVGMLVPGFNEALLSVDEGSVYRVVIPASLGYGEKGIEGVIPGNAALDFTITLEKIIN